MKFWPYLSYNYFKFNTNYLFLGAKQKRAPWVDFYSDMYSHLRGEYTIFYYRKMWLNYLKKINLVRRLFGDKNNQFFFITNRVEHLHLLNDYADRIGGNSIFFERSAQFSYKCGVEDAKYTMGPKIRGLGVDNFLSADNYARADSKIFITLANNNIRDKFFYKQLAGAELDFLTFTPADTNSLYVGSFIPMFGNNDSAKSWHFYLNIFVKSSLFNRSSRLTERSTRDGRRTQIYTKYNEMGPAVYKFGRGSTKIRKNFADFANFSKIKVCRSTRSILWNKWLMGKSKDVAYRYDANSGVFRIAKNYIYHTL